MNFYAQSRYYLLTFYFFIIFYSCNNSSKKDVSSVNSIQIDSTSGENDSLIIQIETKGNTVYKHYKDTAKIKRDNFNDSYNVKSVYKKLFNFRPLKTDFYFTQDSFNILFNSTEVLKYCNRSLSKLQTGNEADLSKERYKKLVEFIHNDIEGEKSPKDIDEYWLPTLLLNCNFIIEKVQTKIHPSYLLVEDYETEFSGGNNFYIVMHNTDTVNFLHMMNWIR
jgi:hypothetical protein